MSPKQRSSLPHSAFFKKLGNIGITIATINAVIVNTPLNLPEVAIDISQYMGAAGTIMLIVSQTATKRKKVLRDS